MAVEVVPGVCFGKLKVIREGPRVPNGAKTARGIVVQCECGSDEFVANINNLRSGRTTSCGCVKRQAAARTAAGQKGKSKEEITANGRQSNLEGQVFGRLTVVEDLGNVEGYRAYRCTCSCGSETDVAAHRLLHEKGPRSCGCLQREAVTKHGMEGTRVYKIWQGMKSRCYDRNHVSFKHYGGRGIAICERWLNDFAIFYADVDEPPSDRHTLDRRDANGNYEPGNCRWATYIKQANNTRANLVLTFEDEIRTAAEWSRITGLNAATIRQRKKRGWTDEQILTTPPDTRFQSR